MEGHSENSEEPHFDKSGTDPQISPGISELLRKSISPVSSSKLREEHESRLGVDSGNDTASTNSELRGQVIYGPRFDYPPMSTSSESRQSTSCPGSSAANDQAPTTIDNAPQSYQTLSSSCPSMLSSPPLQPATDSTSSLCVFPDGDDFDEQPADEQQRIFARACSSDENLGDNSPNTQGLSRDHKIRDGRSPSPTKLDLEGTVQSDELEKPMFASQMMKPEEDDPVPLVDKAQKEAEEEAEWMNFIFDGDIDDAGETAFQEAAKEAARAIRPSSSVSEIQMDEPTTSSSNHYAETVATCGTPTLRGTNGIFFASRFSPDPHFGRPAKRTPFPPQFSLDPDLKVSSDVAERRYRAHHDYPETFRQTMPDNETPMTGASPQSGYSSRTTIDNMAEGAASELTIDNASIIAQPPQSEQGEETTFTFTQPKNFVGSRVTSSVPLPTTLRRNKSSAPAKTTKGRKKKNQQPRAKRSQPHKDGSAFIRALPNYNYNDDPIDGSDD